MDLVALKELYDLYPDDDEHLPPRLALMGLQDHLTWLGWPTELDTPTSRADVWTLEYADLDIPIAEGTLTEIYVRCSLDMTFGVGHSLSD